MLTFIHWIVNRKLENIDRFMPFKEFFSDLKNEGLPRLYSTILLIRRAIFSIFLAMGNSLSSICLTIPMWVIQTLYLAMMVLIRPYKSVKDNLLEIINEVFYFTLVTLLIHFNSDSNWNEPVEMAYFCLILANSFIIISLIIGTSFHLLWFILLLTLLFRLVICKYYYKIEIMLRKQYIRINKTKNCKYAPWFKVISLNYFNKFLNDRK